MRAGVALLLWVLLPIGSVFGAPLDRGLELKVKRGDSFEELAVRYYGSARAARALALANGRDGLSRRLPKVRPGTSLHLPTSWSYRIRNGDTWEALGRDYLGHRKHGLFLARLNSKRLGTRAPVGHVILVPALIPVRVPRRFSLAKLAARLLDRAERDTRVRNLVRWIQDFNGIRRVRAGQLIVVPMASLRLLGWYLPSALPRQDPGTIRRAQAILKRAETAIERGRFLSAAAAMGPLLGRPGLPAPLRVAAQLIRCTAWVALERPRLALRAARAALRLQPGLKLDPVQVSPKVRAVFARARGRHGARRPTPRRRARPR